MQKQQANEPEAQRVGFTVEGEFLTQHARNLVLEGKWRFAVKTLLESLMGANESHVYPILRGDAKLVGTNQVSLVDDDGTDYKKELEWHFGRTFLFMGNFYTPYAQVTGVNKSTFQWNHVRNFVNGEEQDFYFSKRTLVEFANFRGLGYADDPMNDILVRAERDGEMYLCKIESMDYPAFLEATPHPHVAIANQNNIIHKRGWRSSTTLLQSTDWSEGDPENRDISEDFKSIPRPSEVKGQATDSENMSYYTCGGAAEMLRTGKTGAESLIEDRFGCLEDAIQAFTEGDKFAYTLEDDETRNHYRDQIVEQAKENGGFIDIGEYNGKTLSVPKYPFYRWALRDFDWLHKDYPWENVMPPGVKMMGDDRNHTDWIIGAGLTLAHNNDEELTKVVYNKRHEIQESLLTAEDHKRSMDEFEDRMNRRMWGVE